MGKDFQKKLTNSWPFLLLLLVATFLYSFRLDKVPVHLNQDELEFSLNAYSISKTLKDPSGNFLPFYFWHLGSFWATPVITYLTSFFLKFLPLKESIIRFPSVFVGISTVGLLMVLARNMFKGKRLTLLAGVLTAATPVLFMHSRLLLDNLYPVPFVVLWLILLKKFLEKRKIIFLFASGLSLGIGFHSYHAAKIMMPIYFLASLLFLFLETKEKGKVFATFIVGFATPILLALPWFIKYPDSFIANQIGYISGIDRSVNPQSGFWGVINSDRLGQFASSYLNYLGPKILFISGDRSLIHSTQKSGAFTFPMVFLLVFGILYVLFKTKDKFARLILFGFISYPVAASLVNDPSRISRGLVVIPFAILLSLWGIKYLFSFKEKAVKVLVYSILLVSIIQFAVFLIGYFGTYRKESYSWFNNDIGGAIESAIKNTKIRKVNDVYIDRNIYFIERYVKFYSIKNSSDLISKASYFDPAIQEFSSFPVYSLVVIKAEDISGRQEKVGRFEKIETIREPNGYESFYIYYRDK
jgi:4-amino-4-deoxy-L-arabinose transferase-like glycosyltransferase